MLIRLLRRHLRPHRNALLVLLLLQAVSALGMLGLPALNADIVDEGVIPGDTGHVLRLGGVMLAVSLVQFGATAAAVLVGARVAMAVGRDLRRGLFTRILDFSSRELDGFGAASLITRTTNDVQQVQMAVLMGLTMMLMAPIMCVGGTVMALRESVPLSGVLLLALPVLALIFGTVIGLMRPRFRELQDHLDTVTRMLREQITGVRVVRAFVREDAERGRFAETNGRLLSVSVGVGFLMSSMFPLVALLSNASGVAVLWFGGHLVDGGSLQVGGVMAFISYLTMTLMTVMLAIFTFLMMPRAEVCAERIEEVMAAESSVLPPVRGVRETPSTGTVEFDDVTFGYPGAEQPVLRGITLTVRPGQTVGVVGGTGSGKTTLLDLVPRLFDTTSGTVRVDGIDVRELAPGKLSAVVGHVPQKPYLFAGTIASNLRYGRPEATDAELWHALEVAQAADFVLAMPDGLDSEIAQGGANVSGGQRQRLAIARTLVRRPEIYLFDDSFSALDHATDAALRAALAVETAGATVLVVAQRIGTIRDADLIVVLDDGGIAASGTHETLLCESSVYREIVLSQMTEQEAAA